MVDKKNEVAGLVAILGFVSLVFAVAGLAGLLDVVVGSGSSVVVLVTGDGGANAAGAATGDEGSVLGFAVLTAVGIAGLLVARSAIESGYFEPETDEETTAGPDETDDEPERERRSEEAGAANDAPRDAGAV